MTGIYNRHGFDKHVTVYMKQYPEKHCVGVQFDIDDFKLINDIYGHASGDKALQILAESMRKFFPEHAVLGRNGGDEFCIFLPDCTCKEAEEKLVQFTKQKRFFVYEGEKRAFNISLGYAEYPVHAKSQLQLMHCADAALYEVKSSRTFRSSFMSYLNSVGGLLGVEPAGRSVIMRSDQTTEVNGSRVWSVSDWACR